MMDRIVMMFLFAILILVSVVTSSPLEDTAESNDARKVEENGKAKEYVLYEDWGNEENFDDDGTLASNRSAQRRDGMMMVVPMRSSSCFPATASISLSNGEVVTMARLKEGQRVLTATPTGELVYSEVLTFLKRSAHVSSPYLMLETSSTTISLSDCHVIFVANGNNTESPTTKFARDVAIGEWVLVNSDGQLIPERVLHIHEQDMEGAYVPLTEHGTIVVDGVLASCYASFDHSLAHFFMTPIRWWPSLFGMMKDQEDDMPALVYAFKEIGRFVMPLGLQDRMPWASTMLSVF